MPRISQDFLLLCTMLIGFTYTSANDCVRHDTCGPGWRKWNDTCYARTDQPLSWTEARDRCSCMGGVIMAPRSQAENDFIKSLIEGSRDELWIACIDIENQRQWVCRGNSMQTYRNWRSGEPNFNGNPPHCARMISTGEWRDTSCADSHYAVCEHPIGGDNFQLQSWRLLTSCLMGNVICQFPVANINDCAVKCHKEPRCLSFNVLHRGNEKICQLNDSRRFDVNKEKFVIMTKPLCIYGEQ